MNEDAELPAMCNCPTCGTSQVEARAVSEDTFKAGCGACKTLTGPQETREEAVIAWNSLCARAKVSGLSL